MKPRILFVCLGNICRSPAAEAVFRARSDAPCDSAGTAGWHVGKPPYGPMQDALGRRGYDGSNLRARQFESSDFKDFDLIITMDAQNTQDVEALRQGATRVRTLTSYIAGPAPDAVPDPYYTRDFDGALDLIEEAVAALIIAEGLQGETP
ncbi:low molecular weight protein-tyrosine-phosphatase [Roseobacteraceae bacterium S113]